MSSFVDSPGCEQFPEWDGNVRPPVPPPPPRSCDCQAHIFGSTEKFPIQPNAEFAPPAATFDDLVRVERALGFDRFVIVHSTLYGADHRITVNALEGVAERGHIRAIGRLDETTSDREIERLHALGFRGTRLAFRDDPRRHPSARAVTRIIDRIRGLGWHLRLHFSRGSMLKVFDRLKSITTIPVVVDHLGYVDPTAGPDDPTCRLIVNQLRKTDNWWVMLSNGNRLSSMEEGWDDAIPIARAYIAAAPDRLIWGSDWPHVQWRKRRMMNEAETVELLYRYVDGDDAMLRRILVDNPARLHGFA